MAEFLPREESEWIPDNTRGIYALLRGRRHNGRERFDVLYVGMSAGRVAGMWARLKKHRENERLDWSHFTIFEVHDNVTAQEIRELEGLFRHMYRKDSRANSLNIQLCHKPFLRVRQNQLRKWHDAGTQAGNNSRQ